MDNKTHKIYAHINKINGKIYIGQTCLSLESRPGKNGELYLKCPAFGRAILKYGWNNFNHIILIDKRYAKYDLKWYLVTVLTENEKNYENTFWVTELEMKTILSQFNKYKTEKELEDEKFDNLYKMQEKWIKQLDQKEKLIEEMKVKINFYENTN